MISLDKQHRTRDGRSVKLLMVDGGGIWCVIGAVDCGDGNWFPLCWKADGHHTYGDYEHGYDLVEVVRQGRFERAVRALGRALGLLGGAQ